MERVAVFIHDKLGYSQMSHVVANTIDTEWVPKMIAAKDDPQRAAAVIEALEVYVREQVTSGDYVHTGDRKAIRVNSVISQVGKKFKNQDGSDLEVDMNIPDGVRLWLMDGQTRDCIAPILQELHINARAALKPLSPEQRVYSYTIEPDDADPEHWYKLSVRNSYNPANEIHGIGGYGAGFIRRNCMRLVSWDDNRREPEVDPYIPLPGHPDLCLYETVIYLPRGDNAPQEITKEEELEDEDLQSSGS